MQKIAYSSVERYLLCIFPCPNGLAVAILIKSNYPFSYLRYVLLLKKCGAAVCSILSGAFLIETCVIEDLLIFSTLGSKFDLNHNRGIKISICVQK